MTLADEDNNSIPTDDVEPKEIEPEEIAAAEETEADDTLRVETNAEDTCTETAGDPDESESRLLKWKKALQGERHLRQMLLENQEKLPVLQNNRAENIVPRRQLRKWLVTELSGKPNGKDNDNTKDTLPKPVPRNNCVYRANWRVLRGEGSPSYSYQANKLSNTKFWLGGTWE